MIDPEGFSPDQCQTLMLDMDGTLLDLAYDNYMWQTAVPSVFARQRKLGAKDAREELFGFYRKLKGTLDWYCLDHWSDRLGIDVLALHREHSDRIAYLPGAEAFLQAVAASPLRVLLVTNSHPDTLALKAEQTGLQRYFDGIYSSHELGHPKEAQAFWQGMQLAEPFDPGATLFIDDTESVLQSAADFGFRGLLQVTRPDTDQPHEPSPKFSAIESVAELTSVFS